MQALVTDVQHRSAVAGLRGLGRAGVGVLALAPHPTAAGLWSRFAARRSVGPAPDGPGFLACIDELAGRHGPLVVYPGTERSLTALLRRPEALGPAAILPFAPGAPADRLRDKGELARLAVEAGLDVPRTLAQATAAELRTAALSTPCVVKSVASKGALDPPRRVADDAELRALLAGLPDDEPLLVQEAVPGPLTAVAVVVDRDGRLVARHQQSAERLWPPTAGGSSVAISVAPDEELARRSARLVSAAGYWGLAHVQFMESARGALLIDVNLRFYGSLPLALACGANLPAAWHAVVTGAAPTGPPAPYRVGVRYRRLEADLVAASHGSPRLLFKPAARPKTGAMWSADDPLASAVLAAESVGTRAWRRLAARVPR